MKPSGGQSMKRSWAVVGENAHLRVVGELVRNADALPPSPETPL
jgi:hypothetical protein